MYAIGCIVIDEEEEEYNFMCVVYKFKSTLSHLIRCKVRCTVYSATLLRFMCLD